KLVLIDMLEQQDSEEDTDRVQLMTLHAAKGLEFPHVYMMGVEEELLPHHASIEAGTIEEERRLMYVGITRAREYLTLSYARSRRQFGERVATEPSRFLEEMPQEDLHFVGETEKKDPERVAEVAEENLASLRVLLSGGGKKQKKAPACFHRLGLVGKLSLLFEWINHVLNHGFHFVIRAITTGAFGRHGVKAINGVFK